MCVEESRRGEERRLETSIWKKKRNASTVSLLVEGKRLILFKKRKAQETSKE
jgi:hypothetical protein